MTGSMSPWGLWWGSLEGVDLPTLQAAAAAQGFAGVSATPAMVLDGSPSRDPVVPVVMIDPLIRGLPGVPEPEKVPARWRATFLHDEDGCHRAADAVGATIINVAHFLGAPVGRRALVDAIGAIAERAAARGRTVAIEPIPEGAIPDVTAAAAIAREIAHDACGITLDVWHWWRSGGDLEELRALPAGLIRVVQLADAAADVRGSGTAPPSRDRLPPGAGVVPVWDIVELVTVRHPRAAIGIEVFDRGALAQDPARRAAALAAAVGARSPR